MTRIAVAADVLAQVRVADRRADPCRRRPGSSHPADRRRQRRDRHRRGSTALGSGCGCLRQTPGSRPGTPVAAQSGGRGRGLAARRDRRPRHHADECGRRVRDPHRRVGAHPDARDRQAHRRGAGRSARTSLGQRSPRRRAVRENAAAARQRWDRPAGDHPRGRVRDADPGRQPKRTPGRARRPDGQRRCLAVPAARGRLRGLHAAADPGDDRPDRRHRARVSSRRPRG